MDLIPSFSVDHTKIIPGIFISRVDWVSVGDEKVPITTYDIRLKRPNIEPRIDVAAMHSLEHIIATWLRNNESIKNDVIYWGPMGCLTGFYLILKGMRLSADIYELILQAFQNVSWATSVPGAKPENCGAAAMHDLELAKYYAKEFVHYLLYADSKKMFSYPTMERPSTDQGQMFYDS